MRTASSPRWRLNSISMVPSSRSSAEPSPVRCICRGIEPQEGTRTELSVRQPSVKSDGRSTIGSGAIAPKACPCSRVPGERPRPAQTHCCTACAAACCTAPAQFRNDQSETSGEIGAPERGHRACGRRQKRSVAARVARAAKKQRADLPRSAVRWLAAVAGLVAHPSHHERTSIWRASGDALGIHKAGRHAPVISDQKSMKSYRETRTKGESTSTVWGQHGSPPFLLVLA